MTIEKTTKHYFLDDQHPSLKGHFPENSIYPGVVLLDYVIHTLKSIIDEDIKIIRLPNIKFMSPLKPNNPLEITLETKSNQTKFNCYSQAKKIATGQIYFES
ncbi:MAG: hypothetical protein HON94_00540 [Methylococcales bacterium]|jgi:3-hydroxyacyl-[acyl-carrier-protein] dehydratase|nr:hypothetical protein [Methylococcales bacterium]MBT7410723.1 hypothetical protein [Methylococcales bacterium]